MILSEEDAALYYKLWLPLIDYVNHKNKIFSDIKVDTKSNNLDPHKVKKIADKLWDDVSVIDDYLSKHKDTLPEEHKMIISSWKRRISGEFIIERHLKKGSMFIFLDNDEVYKVSGITTSWKDMFGYRPLPVILKATLMSFKEVIISDGLVIPYDIVVGHNIAEGIKKTYLEAKKLGLIHMSL